MDLPTIGTYVTICAFLVAVAPHLRNGYRYVTHSRAMQSFWDGDNKHYVVIYPVHEDPTSASKEYRLVKHETAAATRRVEQFLKGHKCSVTVKRDSEQLSDQERQSNIILIGSSRTNKLVTRDFSKLADHFEFGASGRDFYIIDRRNKVQLASPIDKGISADLAVIMKLPNPYGSPSSFSRVYYLAGVHAVGCWAAAEYVTGYSRLRQLPRCGRDKGLALVIEAKFAGFYNITDLRAYVEPHFVNPSTS